MNAYHSSLKLPEIEKNVLSFKLRIQGKKEVSSTCFRWSQTMELKTDSEMTKILKELGVKKYWEQTREW